MSSRICFIALILSGYFTLEHSISSAAAQISVNNVVVHMAANARPVQNVTVGNSSEHTAYVVVEVESIIDPSRDPGKTEPSDDLLVSPKNFSIEPKGHRTVRILLKSPPVEKERAFRVAFVPQDRGFGEEVAQKLPGKTALIRVLTGMGILVFADPITPIIKLDWERTADKIAFKNNGNVQVFLGEGSSCSPEGKCSPTLSKRLYAGTEFAITTPAANTVTYLKREGGGGEYQKLTIPPKSE